jgi:glucosamine kinase
MVILASMKHWIIADSGGTGTTWVYGSEQESGRFETASLHPRNIPAFPEKDMEKLRELNSRSPLAILDFYGAGMSSETNRELVSELLTEVGFRNFTVETDAVAAGLACCGYEHGFATILGTGSILLEMDKGKLISRTGGLGPEKGDEGSAFFFGKLLLEEVKAGKFKKEVGDKFGTVGHFLSEYENANPSKIAGLAKLTARWNVSELHRKNVLNFISTHILVENPEIRSLGVVGSYGYHISGILKEELEKVNVLLNRVFTTPLDNLVTLRIKNMNG